MLRRPPQLSQLLLALNVVLVSSARRTQHRALFLLALEPCVRSSPHFHIFPPSRHKARSVLGIPCGCQGPVAGEGLQKPLYKASHEARAADFPSATHPTQRRRALSQLSLVLTHWEPWGVGIQEDRSQPGFWNLPLRASAAAGSQDS